MIPNIETLDYDDLFPIINQVVDEIVRRNEQNNVLEVSEIVDYQEYPNVFILDIETIKDSFYNIILTKEQVLSLKERLNQTNYI